MSEIKLPQDFVSYSEARKKAFMNLKALKDILTEDGVKCRIAPAPGAIQGELSCGMSLLIEPEYIEAAKASIAAHHAVYHDIVPLSGQIKSHRDRYC